MDETEAEPEAQAREGAEEGQSSPESITVSYTEGSDYKTVYADGAQGDFTGGGKFFLHFYLEFPFLPENTVHEIEEDGTLGSPLQYRDEVKIERRRQCGVVMDTQTMFELYEWLGRKLSQLEEAAEQSPSSDENEGS